MVFGPSNPGWALEGLRVDGNTGLSEYGMLVVQMLHVVTAHGEEELRTVRVRGTHVCHGHQTGLVVLPCLRLNLVLEKPGLACHREFIRFVNESRLRQGLDSEPIAPRSLIRRGAITTDIGLLEDRLTTSLLTVLAHRR